MLKENQLIRFLVQLDTLEKLNNTQTSPLAAQVMIFYSQQQLTFSNRLLYILYNSENLNDKHCFTMFLSSSYTVFIYVYTIYYYSIYFIL